MTRVPGRVHPLASLSHGNYRLFFCGQVISLVGTWMQRVAQGWLVYELTNSALWLGIVGSADAVPMLIFSLWGGVVADRVRRRRLLLVTQAAAMVLAFVLGVLTAGGWVRVWHVAVIAACGGLVSAFDMPARQAFVVNLVSREHVMNAIALNSTMFNSARIIGPALAGILVAVVGVAGCFLINGASFIAVLIALSLIRLDEQPQKEPGSHWSQLADGLRYVRGNAQVMGLLWMLAMVSVFGWSYAVLLPVFARDILQVGARGLGFLVSGAGVGALLAALTLAWLGDYPRKERLLFGGLVCASVALAGFALSRYFPLSLVTLAATGGGLMMYFATQQTLLQLAVSDEMRGRVMGLRSVVFAGLAPAGSLLIGALGDALGARGGLLISAGLCGATALVMRFTAPALLAVQPQPASDPPPAPPEV